MFKLSISTLNYKTKEMVLSCVDSLIKQYKLELERDEFEIIIADNGSGDESVAYIKKHLLSKKIKNILLIDNKKNLGFGAGNNFAAKKASGKYILFLNSDTIVEDRGFILMIDFLDKHENVGVLGGKLSNNDGTIQPSAGKFYNLLNLTVMLVGGERFGLLRSSPNEIEKVDWVSGACMMVRKDVFEKLSGFDEKLFMYMEDMEICFRAKKLGFSTYFYPNLRLKHKSLGSSNRTFAIINIYKGILHFYSKHKSHFEYLIAKLLLVAKAFILILVGILTINPGLQDRYRKAIRF